MARTRQNASKKKINNRRAPAISTPRPMTAPPISNAVTSNKLKKKPTDHSTPRIELFFSSPDQLRERVNLLQSYGYHKFNLVNKNAQDTILDWTTTIREECPTADICAHYSLKYNKVTRQGNDAHVGLLQEFTAAGFGNANEVLIVSGGHNAAKPRPKWNTVGALQQLQAFTTKEDLDAMPTLSVAYNPYIPNPQLQNEEDQRLKDKLETGLISKVYLQFGTDLVKLKAALEMLKAHTTIAVAGSLFLPTKQLLAQQKFRPWNGVFLSKDFLEGPEKASAIVMELMKLYSAYQVEALWEAPGVRKEDDLQMISELMIQATVGEEEGEIAGDVEELIEANRDDSDNNAISAKKEFYDGSAEAEESLFSLMLKDDDDEKEGSKPPAKAKPTQPNPAAKVSSVPSPANKRQKTLTEDGLTSSSLTKLPSSASTCILLFGPHDLRLYDNKAVHAACQQHATVVPVFLWSPYSVESGGIRAQALEVLIKDALGNLESELQAFGLKLIRRHCPTTATVKQQVAGLLEETGATAIYYNTDFTPNGRELEEARKQVVESKFAGVVQHKPYQSVLLYDIDRVDLVKGFHGGHWGTLMPFYNSCRRNLGGLPRRPMPKHETFGLLQKIKGPANWPASQPNLPLAVLHPKVKPWHQPIRDTFPNMSYQGAQDDMDAFFQASNSGFRRYDAERSRADKERSTSRLSAHFRVGTLSPNELFWRHEDHPLYNGVFQRRLVWRDLAYYQLRCFPSMPTYSIRAHYQKSGWCTGEEAERRFQAWKTGQTGYPIVDAGMRELYATGWMNQSVRMVVAYFLVNYLRVHWVKGCEWFHYTLVDADTAINAMMWQNAGKSGVDQWNFVISPESGSQDPTGRYTKKWIPELRKLSLDTGLHRPWETPLIILQRYGISLGEDYPHRVVTRLKEERAKSIESIMTMRRNSQAFNDNKGYDLIELPNGQKTVVFTLKEFRIDREGRAIPSQPRSGQKSTRKRKGKK